MCIRDSAGSVELLLDINPNMKIIATGCAVNFLKNIVNRDFYSIQVKDNESMKIGDKTLTFMTVPNLHWPDTMYTWIEEDKILVTCDSFGAHYGVEGVLRSCLLYTSESPQAAATAAPCITGLPAYFLRKHIISTPKNKVKYTFCAPGKKSLPKNARSNGISEISANRSRFLAYLASFPVCVKPSTSCLLYTSRCV